MLITSCIDIEFSYPSTEAQSSITTVELERYMRTSSHPAPGSELVETDQFVQGSARLNYASFQSLGDSTVFLDIMFKHPHGDKSFPYFSLAGLCLRPLVLYLGSSDPSNTSSKAAEDSKSSTLAIVWFGCKATCRRGRTLARVLSAQLQASDLLQVHLAGWEISFFSILVSPWAFWETLQMITF